MALTAILAPWNPGRREVLQALLLGLCGFLLNMLELQLGWGLHFMFGNALVFAFIRVLKPQSVLVAAAISSLRSLFLWNHPWAWLIWTLEAAFVTSLVHKTSPVRSDVIFWLVIGTPLLLVSYGAIMAMDQLSLALVIAKQATNGTLNVVLGEIIYLTVLALKSHASAGKWPSMPIDSFLMMILMAIILIPTTVYLALDAPSREQAARDEVDQILRERLEIVDATVSMWVRSRSLILDLHAERSPELTSGPLAGLPRELLDEFSAVSDLDSQSPEAQALRLPITGEATLAPARQASQNHLGPRLVAMPAPSGTASPQLSLVVPQQTNGETRLIVARLRQNVLSDLIGSPGEKGLEDVFMAHAGAGIFALSSSPPELDVDLAALPSAVRAQARMKSVLVSETSYGNALMTDLRDARMLRTGTIAALPGWQTLAVSHMSPQVLQAREGQLHLFAALSGFVLLVTALGSALSKLTQQSLRYLAKSAADLAVLGTVREKIDDLVIRELNDISGTIAAARSRVLSERGALGKYRRRLESIARHAPVVVYALDIVGQRKGKVIYISDTLEKILGYSLADVQQPGWWTHAIHADDYERCTAAFSNLEPGKVVSLEYRIRHRAGHFIWLYDTLSVEAGSEPDQIEAVGLLIDITERKVAAEQLLQADKMASLGRIIAGTAHELNQPLNFIKMAAVNLREQARRGHLDPANLLARLDKIQSQISRASAIILQMRVFGRTPKELPYPVDVKTCIDAIVSMVEPQLEIDGTRIDVSRCPTGIRVRALPVLLEQVLLNLLLNANDAIRVRRSTGNGAPGHISITLAARQGRAIITVEDNGTGLAADVMPFLFEPFFTTKPPREGTGLGLSISYGIIQDLGGMIRAENTRSGARFVIKLPLAPALT